VEASRGSQKVSPRTEKPVPLNMFMPHPIRRQSISIIAVLSYFAAGRSAADSLPVCHAQSSFLCA